MEKNQYFLVCFRYLACGLGGDMRIKNGAFKTQRGQYEGNNTPLGYYTDCSPMGLGQYNNLGEYCCPHTAPSVF